MADDVVKEKVKRTKKAPIQEEAVEDNSPAPIIDAVKSDPPLPKVVISPVSFEPINPVTICII